jgi:outer membrane protein TolC
MTVGPDYKAPSEELKPFHSRAVLEARSASVATFAPSLNMWWLGFNDPELTKLVQRAQKQNLDLAVSLARVEQARSVAKEAHARRLPSWDLDIQTTTMHQSLLIPIGELASPYPGYRRNETLIDEDVGANWEMNLFGGLCRGEEAGTDEAAAAKADQLGTGISVMADVTDAYFQVRGDQGRLKSADQQIDVDSHLLTLVKQRFDQSASSDREVAQSEALVEQAQAMIPALGIDLEGQLNCVDVLMGAQPDTYTAELTVTPEELLNEPAIHGNLRPEEMLRHIVSGSTRARKSGCRSKDLHRIVSTNRDHGAARATVRFWCGGCRSRPNQRGLCRSACQLPASCPARSGRRRRWVHVRCRIQGPVAKKSVQKLAPQNALTRRPMKHTKQVPFL